jgi:adenosylmethionine-8-amino-7-oxononanoate aminotransferase
MVEQVYSFVALENGYHGETIGALAVGDIPLYRRVYAPLLSEALFAPSPDAYLAEPGESAAACAARVPIENSGSADAPARIWRRVNWNLDAVMLVSSGGDGTADVAAQ